MSDQSAIQHIFDHCLIIEEYLRKCNCKNIGDFIENKMLHDAVLIHLLDIGELIKNHISDEFIAQHQNAVDWRGAIGLRNIAAHRYNTVRFEMIWDIITCEIPSIKQFCETQM